MQIEFSERYRTMGLKIAYDRKEAGYTQKSFAEAVGKSANSIAQGRDPESFVVSLLKRCSK